VADKFDTIFDYTRVEPIVDSRGVMTTKFAQTLTFLVNNSNSTGEIIDDETLSISTIAGNPELALISESNKRLDDQQQSFIPDNSMMVIAEQNKTISSLENLLAQKTNESATLAEIKKEIEELRELIAHVS